MDIVITAVKPWTVAYIEKFMQNHNDITTYVINDRKELTLEALHPINPKYVFFPHWSWYIPRGIYERFTCIIFHPSDVPFGRGGTPVQNLIALGHTETVISAIKANGELDAGDVFLKRRLSLLGGGEEIMLRMQSIIFNDMIPHIIKNDIKAKPQIGEPLIFKRRTPEMSEIRPDMAIEQIFNAIRMLDIDDYPHAYIHFGDYTVEFTRPSLSSSGIYADAKIYRSEKN